ncbi:site-specific integrase [Bacillus cereus group sp. BfR-BA-01383]|uniref:tyrosine-type recombinase/integrase n=1 Tax=Bacillus cereus group sp. BfR-BA-01383 TaxID=2920327 RepID=UPI001F5726C7|nr:site-specific integrase [Bacillus cereus group sp. BfR-BA-01383]
MGVIREKQTLLGTVYERYDSNNELIQRFGAIGYIKKSTERKMTYFIVTDINGNLIVAANKYLNKEIGDAKYKKRESAFSALKVFFSFLELVHINNPTDLTNDDIKDLRLFLEGGKKDGQVWGLDLRVRRDNQTFNHYLNVYRDFLYKMYDFSNTTLFDTIKIGVSIGKGFFAHVKKTTHERYTANKNVGDLGKSVPKYIRPNEYKKIMGIVEENYGLREKVIINLMYDYGLRLGEVLGTTFEDIEQTNNGYYRLIIRNRVSDKPTQRAKGVMVPETIDTYSSRSYNTEGNGLGYQVVFICEDMGELIQEYIDESRDDIVLSQSPKKRENLNRKTIADRVGTISLLGDENQYIFLNHQHYTSLSQAGWNYILRKIFAEAGISMDKNKKETNLSHRFRHAFAMKLAKQGSNEYELQKALRHKSPESCKTYYNPDENDKVELLMKNKERFYSND